MQPKSMPKFGPLLPTLVLLILISFAATNKGEESPCKPEKCGGVHNISYPFWLRGKCDGYPAFELVCEDDRLFLANPFANPHPKFPNDPKYGGVDKIIHGGDPCFWLITIEFITSQFDGNECQLDLHTNISQVNKTFILQDCPGGPYNESNDIFRTCLINNAYFAPDYGQSYWERLSAAAKECRILLTIPILPNYDEHPLNGTFLADWSDDRDVRNCSACTDCGEKCTYDRLLPGRFSCLCKDGQRRENCDDTPNQDPPPETNDTQKDHKKQIVTGVCAGFAGLVTAGLLFCLYLRCKKTKQISSSSAMLSRTTRSDSLDSHKDPEIGDEQYHTQIFMYEELEEATDGFSASNELGEGGFGTVYKGKLRDGRTVAIKKFKNNYRRTDLFLNEVYILSSFRHQNLVCLYGCTSRHARELLLVYEYVPNGTVADHLHGLRAREEALTWPLRLRIAIEAADALRYLHAVTPQLIHRDVKTNNILLDKSFQVKVADFGLSKLFPLNATHVSTAPQGTPGYLDPEYRQCYQLTDKSDVYSFGVVLAELISSKPAVDLDRQWDEINLGKMALIKIQNQELDELIDPKLWFQSSLAMRTMMKQVAEVAFRCLQAEREMRPTMKEVLEELREIENEGGNVENGEEEGDAMNGEESLLRKRPSPYSPDTTVGEQWESKSTTPNSTGL